ncbi:MAG: bifunctional oligoribonuclease/PAP phosphatase NrnA [Treponema sp.]|jgi:phosphoesterase RecJ-like protein|nr:bifunctional oligoribonuclease/PAP phosphatase NrnA [Treponema sp.]
MLNPLPVPAALLDFINRGAKFIVAGHKEPDGDCVGSQLALASALRRLGKEAIPCSAGPFKRSEVMPYEDCFIAQPGEEEREGAGVILMDCSTKDRTGGLEPALEGLPLAVIDHHAATRYAPADPSAGPAPGLSGGDPLLYIDPEAPSVTFMTLGIIEALGLEPSPEEAELLLFGLCTDTGFFRHVDNRGAETFARASRLIAAGASPKRVFAAINGGKSLDSRIFTGLVLSRAQPYFEGRLILSAETYEDLRRFGPEGRDSDNLYQLLQSVKGVEAIAIIRQESPEACTVGLRSRDAVDVAALALQFGGGGHKNAAGLSMDGTIDIVRPRILEAFNKIFA